MRKRTLSELQRPTLEEYRVMPKKALIAVLDNVRSALNVGSVFRTADAFNIEKIILCGITATPPHREITKTAIGATESVAWEYHADIISILAALKNDGYLLVGVEQTDTSTPLQQFQGADRPVAVVFGNEVEGIQDDVLPLLDLCVEIPQSGTKHSLNVSVCAGIILWELAGKSIV
jgi:23S rRNA (guanosine2251-2'-O)-methyltransferase